MKIEDQVRVGAVAQGFFRSGRGNAKRNEADKSRDNWCGPDADAERTGVRGVLEQDVGQTRRRMSWQGEQI